MGDPIDDALLRRNYDLCRAVNLNALGSVLDSMVQAGLSTEQAECFKTSAYALLQLMRSENNRLAAEAHAITKDPAHD
jgi:hypothetical protein